MSFNVLASSLKFDIHHCNMQFVNVMLYPYIWKYLSMLHGLGRTVW